MDEVTRGQLGPNALHHAFGKNGCADPTAGSYLLTYRVGGNDLNSAGLSPSANYFSGQDIVPYSSEMEMVRLLFDSSADLGVISKQKQLSLDHLYARDYYVSVGVLSPRRTQQGKTPTRIGNTSNEALLLHAAKEVMSRTGDATLHVMLAEATAKIDRKYLETDQSPELVGNFGIAVLRRAIAAL